MCQGKDIYEDMYMHNLKSFKSFILGMFTVTLLATAHCFGQTEAPRIILLKGQCNTSPLEYNFQSRNLSLALLPKLQIQLD